MLTLWTVMCAVLAVIAMANLALLLGMATRIRVLQNAAAAGPASRLPEVGRTIRPFELTTMNGGPLDDHAFASGTTIVGFFTTGCRKCARIRSALAETPPPVPTVVMINGSPSEPETRAMGLALREVGPVAYFEDLSVARAFGVLGYPTLLRIEDGKIAAAGRGLEDVGGLA